MELPYLQLDVFTSVRLEGNGLAVVLEAAALSDAAMGAFARETRQSETTFVQPASVEGADYRNRIWTIEGEIPFAGHPSLGTAVAVARSRGLTEASLVQQTGAGLQPIDVELDDDAAHASMLQEPAELGERPEPAEAMAAVGLEADDAHPDMPPQLVSTGLPTLIVPVMDDGAIGRCAPDFDAIAGVLGRHPQGNVYVAWCDLERGRAHARMFTAMVMGGEDPATGSAAGPLCVYLAEHAGVQRVDIAQGVEMGRPSRLVAELEGDRVRVGGDVMVVAEGTVRLPRAG